MTSITVTEQNNKVIVSTTGSQGATGVAGPSGTLVRSGSSAPQSSDGNNGDWWIETTNSRLYGPKASGSWPGSYVSLIGPGATVGVDSTVTGNAGTSASVTNEGSSSAASFKFTIPKGDKGDTGDTGLSGASNIVLDTTPQLGGDLDANGNDIDMGTNVITDARVGEWLATKTKVDGIENSATADMTGSEIKSAYEGESNTNAFTDAEKTKLSGIATSANNYVHPNHSGEVTSSADGATVIASNIVDEDNLKISNSPSNGTFLQYKDGTDELTWATPTDTNTQYTAGTGMQLSGTEFSVTSLALTTVQEAANETQMLALTTQEGDVVVRTDENKSYVKNSGSSNSMSDFTLLRTPTDAVLSVNGNTGAITAAQIASAVEAASDSNTFTDADHTKLNSVESNSTADQTGAEIKTAYEAEADTNAFTDTLKTKLDGIATGAEVNVQSDWNSSSGDSQILNKPTIPTNTDTTYSISCVDGDNTDEEKIRLTAGGDGSGTDDVVLEAGTGLSIARSGDKITFTNTVTDTDTQLTTEEVQDIIGAMVAGNTETNISVTYDDTNGKLDFVSTDTNTTYSVVTSSANGLAPQLPASHGGKFLKADGTWEVPPDTNTEYSIQDGQLSQNNFTNADHTKLDGIAASANNYAISSDLLDEDNMSSDSATKVPSQQSVKAYVDANTGTTNLSNTANGTSLTVESSTGSNTTLPAATTSAWGVMTDDDKTKLDGIATGATSNVGDITGVTAGTGLTGGGTSGGVTVNADVGIADDKLVQIDDADAADDDYAKFTANGIEGRSYAEVKTDLSLNNVENTAVSTWAGSTNITTLGAVSNVTSTANGTAGVRKITASTSAPSGGSDGDVWIKYTA